MANRFNTIRVVLGVTGSISAYKAVALLRTLSEAGAQVTVVMTAAATRFVAPLTFEVLSKQPVYQDLFAGPETMPHLTLTEATDVLLIAPTTAHTLAKCALGLADDLLSAMVLAARCPIVMAPAMDGDMWNHPTVVEHTRLLRERGVTVLDPEDGPLASGLIGKGRLPQESLILDALEDALSQHQDYSGQRVLVSAGPTREPIDAVRFISNASSGKMGYAVATAAAQRGAEVILVSGPTSLSAPHGVIVVPVTTAEEMFQALDERFGWSTILVMTAAVGDFRPQQVSVHKVKKQDWTGEPLALERTTDILSTLSRQRTHQILVGFAAETDSLIEHAQQKLYQKNLDLIVVNRVGGDASAFGNDTNQVTLISRDNEIQEWPRMPKPSVARRLLDTVLSFTVSRGVSAPPPVRLRSL